MPELQRYRRPPQIELDRFDATGNARDVASSRGAPQRFRPLHPHPVAEVRDYLAHILEAIPEPHQHYLPSRLRWPAAPNAYHPNEYIDHGYTYQITEIDATPRARDRASRPVRARKTDEWRNYTLASLFGAFIGIFGYAFLLQVGARNAESELGFTSAREIAKIPGEESTESDSTYVEPTPSQLNSGNAPPPRPVPDITAERKSWQGGYVLPATYYRNLPSQQETQALKPDTGLTRKGPVKEKAVKLDSPKAPQGHKRPSKPNASASGSEVLRQ